MGEINCPVGAARSFGLVAPAWTVVTTLNWSPPTHWGLPPSLRVGAGEGERRGGAGGREGGEGERRGGAGGREGGEGGRGNNNSVYTCIYTYMYMYVHVQYVHVHTCHSRQHSIFPAECYLR